MLNAAEPRYKLGVTLFARGEFVAALAAYDAALAVDSANAKLHYSRGNTLAKLNRPDEAIAAYTACLALDPGNLSARYNRATVQASLQRWTLALADLDETLARSPTVVDAWNNRAGVLQAMGRCDEALASIAQVLRFRPADAGACYNAGIMLLALNRFDEAVQALERALYLNPDHVDARGCLVSAALRACDWPKLEELLPALFAEISEGKGALPPLTLLAISDDPILQRRCAEISTRRAFAVTRLERGDAPAIWRGTAYQHQRLRVGYLSSDFRDHPVATQLVGLLEAHDRERFEIIGLASGASDNGRLRTRIEQACDQFHDVGSMGSFEAAQLIRELEVDILVDLNGHTLGWRPDILKYRPAPVSVSYLGFAGTTGTDFIDYVIGDRQVTPFELSPAMSEKIVQLPHSFWPSDHALQPRPVTRAEAGLPEEAFVFCCFNSGHKIRPQIFSCWMRLLTAVPNAVLWLRGGDPSTNERLVQQAKTRGVDESRIIFAPRVHNYAKHLGRMRRADLFLDTFPYNAHVIASEALWAGLPLLTLRGRSFAGRVAAGFLAALGLDDLITSTIEDYEQLALSLSTNPGRLAEVRDRLWEARQSMPLFRIKTLARDLERAYCQMIERVESGPACFSVAPLET